jgi:hypothetical protein
MYQIISDPTEEEIKVYESWTIGGIGINQPPTFQNIGDRYEVSITDLDKINTFKTFSLDYTLKSESRQLKTEWRVSRNGITFTPWIELPTSITEFPPHNDSDTLQIDLRFTRIGNSDNGVIRLLNWSLDGLKFRLQVDGESTITLSENVRQIIVKPPFIFKVFKIEDIEVLSSDPQLNDVTIKFRYSQDYGRSVSDWEYFTASNLKRIKINPIRFFQIEYLLEYTGNSIIKIYDINIIGDFQNVTEDYKKSNLFGLRENCNCERLGIVGDPSSSTTSPTGGENQMLTSQQPQNQLPQLSQDQVNSLFKPYQLPLATELLSKMSGDANQIFGHEVVYFLTDPDKRGIDFSFHEYQLYNYVCDKLIKISVENNQFPDNQISFNQFDLSLFQAFEVHIPKKAFKEAFGVDKRPSKEDFMWFCEQNRMFVVEHAQQFRSFNNNSVYYKLQLKKYVQKANVAPVNQQIQDKLTELTKNTTINELFGKENQDDKKSVANKTEFRPLTRDITRVSINANIIKELIENAEIVISKNNYDLSSVPFSPTFSTDAVIYENMKNYFGEGENLSFSCWFNLFNYTVDDTYTFFSYYDETNSLGIKIELKTDNIKVVISETEYNFPLMNVVGGTDGLQEDVWYAYLLNINQRQKEIRQFIYKRDIEDEDLGSLNNSTILQLVKSNQEQLTPFEFVLDGLNASLKSGDFKITNIRLFSEIIPIKQHSNILNQYHLRDDTKYLILGDNANMRLSLPYMPLDQVGKKDVG